MQSQKPYILSNVEEVVVWEVEEDEETTFADEEGKVTSGPKSGAAGAAPILITSTIVGRRTAITNGLEVVIKRAGAAMNAEKQDTSRRIVQSIKAEMVATVGLMVKAMEPVLDTELDFTVKAKEPAPEVEVDSTVKAMEPVPEVEVDSTVRRSRKLLMRRSRIRSRKRILRTEASWK